MSSGGIWRNNLIIWVWWKNIAITCIEFASRYKLRFWLLWIPNSNKYSFIMSFRKKINSNLIPINLKINYLIISKHFTWNYWHYSILRSQYKWRFKLRKFEAYNIFNGAVSDDSVRNVELAVPLILTSISW